MDVPIFGVVVGIAFVMLLFSVLASHLTEIVATWLGLRGVVLYRSIAEMFQCACFRDQIYRHPLLQSVSIGRGRMSVQKPSYIDPKVFALVVMNLGIVFTEPEHNIPGSTSIREDLGENPNKILTTLVGNTFGSVTATQAILEQWFTTCTKRISGTYKRVTFPLLLLFSVLIVAAFDVDVVRIATRLYYDPSLRTVTVQQAQGVTKNDQNIDVSQALAHLQLPLGWGSGKKSPQMVGSDVVPADGAEYFVRHPFLASLGLLLAAGLLSLGAPFWFDMANKITNVRGVGPSSSSNAITVVPKS